MRCQIIYAMLNRVMRVRVTAESIWPRQRAENAWDCTEPQTGELGLRAEPGLLAAHTKLMFGSVRLHVGLSEPVHGHHIEHREKLEDKGEEVQLSRARV
jgi:hypothetical protein